MSAEPQDDGLRTRIKEFLEFSEDEARGFIQKQNAVLLAHIKFHNDDDVRAFREDAARVLKEAGHWWFGVKHTCLFLGSADGATEAKIQEISDSCVEMVGCFLSKALDGTGITLSEQNKEFVESVLFYDMLFGYTAVLMMGSHTIDTMPVVRMRDVPRDAAEYYIGEVQRALVSRFGLIN